MRRIMAVAISAVLLSFTAAALGQESGTRGAHLGLHGGTLGPGVNAGYDFSKDLALRGLVNYFNLDFDKTRAGNEYSGDLKLRSAGVVLDWHPFWGAFRVSGGGFLNNNHLSASTSGVALGIGEGMYDAELDFQMEFERLAPYFGIGWTSGRGQGGLSFSADLGVLFRSTPLLSASGRTHACDFVVSKGGSADVDCFGDIGELLASELRTDLEREHGELLDDLDRFEVYPVVSLGASYRF